MPENIQIKLTSAYIIFLMIIAGFASLLVFVDVLGWWDEGYKKFFNLKPQKLQLKSEFHHLQMGFAIPYKLLKNYRNLKFQQK